MSESLGEISSGDEPICSMTTRMRIRGSALDGLASPCGRRLGAGAPKRPTMRPLCSSAITFTAAMLMQLLLLVVLANKLEAGRLAPLQRQRRATIEFSSPMKRIMDLIGQHAPVIVVDSSHDSHESTQAGQRPEAQAQLVDQTQQVGQVQAQFVQPAAQIQTAQQQQHWTLVDASQMALVDPQQQQQQQQQSQHQQQQFQFQIQPQPQLQLHQQPTAQQQQLVQTSVQPNEQYFTFTPFGLAPGASMGPFVSPPAFIGLHQQHQQHQQQPSPNQFDGFNMMSGQPALTTMTSQLINAQQPQPSAAATPATSDPVQPVFLSSYVPELPVPGGTPQAPLQQQQHQQQQHQLHLQQVQQPNSIQQIQQAQKVADAASRVKSSADGDAPEAEEPADRSSGGADAPDAGPDEFAGGAGGGGDEPEGGSGTGSGSLSYEDKYDSDKEPGGEQSQQPRRSSSPPTSAAPASSSAAGGLANTGLDDDCIQCICRASSGCDHLLRCITVGAEERLCGPFQLDEEYWQRAGSPGDSTTNFSSFEECANDAECAVETVTKYMRRYYRDCDNDDRVTCLDYARIHRLGPQECANNAKLETNFQDYWAKFQFCADSYNRTRNGDDEEI